MNCASSPTWQRNELLYKSRLSESAARKAATTDDTVLAREAREESMQYAIDGGRAANLFRENADSIDMMAINAGLTVARRLGQSGTALQLLETALERNATMAADLGIQARYAVILADAGDFGRSKASLKRLRPGLPTGHRPARDGRGGRAPDPHGGVGPAGGGSPGLALTQAAVARAAEHRRTPPGPGPGHRRRSGASHRGWSRSRAPCWRSPSDYESMCMYATRPRDRRTPSGEASPPVGLFDDGSRRSRRLAEIAYEHPEDVDVQQASPSIKRR